MADFEPQVRLDHPGYREAEYQEFSTFEEAEDLLRGYCALCAREQRCEINHALRRAMGENYPMWSNQFVKLVARDETLMEDEDDGLPEIVVGCKNFESKQEKFSFAS